MPTFTFSKEANKWRGVHIMMLMTLSFIRSLATSCFLGSDILLNDPFPNILSLQCSKPTAKEQISHSHE
jgi:hypothetical protein